MDIVYCCFLLFCTMFFICFAVVLIWCACNIHLLHLSNGQSSSSFNQRLLLLHLFKLCKHFPFCFPSSRRSHENSDAARYFRDITSQLKTKNKLADLFVQSELKRNWANRRRRMMVMKKKQTQITSTDTQTHPHKSNWNACGFSFDARPCSLCVLSVLCLYFVLLLFRSFTSFIVNRFFSRVSLFFIGLYWLDLTCLPTTLVTHKKFTICHIIQLYHTNQT